MAGTIVEILDATYVPIDIAVEVTYDRRYQLTAVQQAVETAIQTLLAFANVDFAQTLYLSDVYGAVETLPGVTAVSVTEFRRDDSPVAQFTGAEIAAAAAQLPVPVTGPQIDVADLIRRAVQIAVTPDGRITLQDFEIPVLGTLSVVMVDSSS
jgi:hypothetical protein